MKSFGRIAFADDPSSLSLTNLAGDRIVCIRQMASRRRINSWGLFLDALRGTVAVTATIVAALLAVLLWRWAPDFKLPLWVVVFVGLLILFVGVALISALRAATKMISFGSTKIVTVKQWHAPYLKCECLCIIELADPWQIGTTISFHWNDDDYERPLGFGSVVNEQDDGRTIVAIQRLHGGEAVQAFVKRLKNNEQDAIKLLRAKAVVVLPLAQTKDEESPTTDPNGPVVPALLPTPSNEGK